MLKRDTHMNHCAKANRFGRSPIASATAKENENGTTQILLHCKLRSREHRASRQGLAEKPFALIASEGVDSRAYLFRRRKARAAKVKSERDDANVNPPVSDRNDAEVDVTSQTPTRQTTEQTNTR